MQKQNSSLKRTNAVMQQLSKSEYIMKPIETMLKSMANSGKNSDYCETNRHEYILQKKIPSSNLQPVLITEKTTKIKKNKKKKKKVKQVSEHKIWKSDMCECCCTKTRTEEPEEVESQLSQNQEEYEEDDSATIANLATCIIYELLEQFYDDFDKNLVKWMKGMDERPGPAFMNLMRKLAEKFEQFDLQLREEMERQFLSIDDHALIETKDEAPAEFKTYMIGRFPLLKDFIQNFDLKVLTQKQNEQLIRLSVDNQLIELILKHMLEIANKKRKKKNKKKKQQLKKLLRKEQKQSEPIISYEQSVVTWIRDLKIDVEARTPCLVQQEWIKKLEEFRQIQ